MPFDKTISDRVRPLLARRPGLLEKKMFGGVGFLLHGNMCVGVWKDFLIARVGHEDYEGALTRPGSHEFDITGRPMQGWVMVDASGIARDNDLAEWVDQCVTFVESLPKKRPPKKPSAKKRPAKKSPGPKTPTKKTPRNAR